MIMNTGLVITSVGYPSKEFLMLSTIFNRQNYTSGIYHQHYHQPADVYWWTYRAPFFNSIKKNNILRTIFFFVD